MINKDYDYVTKTGSIPVKFYTFNAMGAYPIHGAILIKGISILMAWNERGRADPAYSMSDGKDWDLVKAKYSPKKEKSILVLSSYPAPLPQRILAKFSGKKVKITLEEL